MALKGDLTSVGLADVFQMLALNQKVGILSIFDADHWRALYFDRRGVTLYYNEHVFLDRLLDGLVHRGHLVPDTLDVFRRENSGDPIATVESMLGAGVLGEALFLDAFREQMEEDVYDLFLWENVHWEFLEGVDSIEGREGVINEHFFLSPDSLVMEAARRLDEWAFLREQVPGPLEIYEPDPNIDTHTVTGLDDFSLSLLQLVDGKRNVGRIVEMSGVTPFHVYKGISQLVGEGLVYAVPDDRLLETANECIQEGRVEDGIYLLEKSIQIGVGIPDAYLLTARSYESQDEYAKGVYHYKCFANHCVEAGDLVQAEGSLSRCCELLPTDLDARERWMRVLVRMENPPADPQDLGRRLIDLYLDLDEPDRARQILEILLEVAPNDIELKKSLVAIHSKAGDQKRVMELYESIADDLVAQKDPIGAVRYLQKILMLDRTRRDVSDRVKQLYMLDERHRSRRRSMALVFAGLFCFGALGFVYYLYEQHVHNAFLALDAEARIGEGDYEGAIAMYREFQRKYPLSMIGGEVDAAIASVEAKKASFEALRVAAEQEKAKKASQNRSLYQRIYAQYEALSSTHEAGERIDLEKAIAQLEEVHRLIQKAGEPEDFDFAREKRVEEALREQRNYLIRARGLRRRFDEKLEMGDFAAARTLALQMHEEFPYANATLETLVPFELVTEPAGAQIWNAGKRLEDAIGRPIRTPAYVSVPFAAPVSFDFRLEGYEELQVTVLGRQDSPSRVVLPVRPERVLDLGAETVTGIAVGQGIGLVGLKEGRLRAFRLEDGKTTFEIRLRGLAEVRGTPLAYDDVGVFATSNGFLRCVSIEDGRTIWNVEVPGGVRTRLVGLDSGLVLGTGGGELRFYALGRGEPLWTVEVGGTALHDPVLFRDRVWIANREGRYLCIAEDDGEVLESWQLPVGLRATPILLSNKRIAYLLGDGRVQSYSLEQRELEWEARFGATHEQSCLLLSQGWLFVVDDEGRVSRVDPATGQIVTARQLPSPAWGSSFASDERLYVGTRSEESSPRMVALRVPDLEIRWSYSLGKGTAGWPELSGRSVLAEIDGKVHLLR